MDWRWLLGVRTLHWRNCLSRLSGPVEQLQPRGKDSRDPGTERIPYR
jgi:hypothetical protein